ncbi:hypothetical protein [Burkholderia vietnamiensis]|uniref:hypothetical protein n=1 Tax=Burkholderia vietnamiensis TaxID=60552 RepID=UPI001BA01038|nr:hypothetical protein [Burkholderia vietnamiensis]MBR8030812.1 hypothetical protein [Burkholderia vietnamiensis]
MRLVVKMSLPAVRHWRHFRANWVTFECRAVRLRGPVRQGTPAKPAPAWIYADVIVPDKYRDQAAPHAWNPDGTYPVEVPVNWNAKTLAPFIASGDLEWNVGGHE